MEGGRRPNLNNHRCIHDLTFHRITCSDALFEECHTAPPRRPALLSQTEGTAHEGLSPSPKMKIFRHDNRTLRAFLYAWPWVIPLMRRSRLAAFRDAKGPMHIKTVAHSIRILSAAYLPIAIARCLLLPGHRLTHRMRSSGFASIASPSRLKDRTGHTDPVLRAP